MANDKDDSTMLFILSGIQASIRSVEEKIDDRWDKALVDLVAQKERLDHLEEEVKHTTKVLTTGNGKPSIVTQVFKLQNDVAEVKETVKTTLDEIGAIKKAVNAATPASVRVERWKTLGLVITFLTTVIASAVAYYT